MTPQRQEPVDGERASLDDVLTRLYEVISFNEGGEPDWDGMKDVFSRHARITRVTPEGTDHLDLPTFCAMAREMLDTGAYTGFHEREVSRRVDRLGAIVHVLSAYETKRHPAAVDRLGQGVNSIQLVNEDGGWRVVSLAGTRRGFADPASTCAPSSAGRCAVDSPRFRFAPSRIVDATNRFVSEAADAGVIMNRAEHYDGPLFEVDGRPMRNFGSCSYLGLEVRDDSQGRRLRGGAPLRHAASFSRAYLEHPLYRELEEQLASMTGGHVLVAPSTTLGHIAALPVLVREGDAVLIDQFAHASLHTATALLRDIPVERVRHNHLDRLETRIAELSAARTARVLRVRRPVLDARRPRAVREAARAPRCASHAAPLRRRRPLDELVRERMAAARPSRTSAGTRA